VVGLDGVPVAPLVVEEFNIDIVTTLLRHTADHIVLEHLLNHAILNLAVPRTTAKRVHLQPTLVGRPIKAHTIVAGSARPQLHQTHHIMAKRVHLQPTLVGRPIKAHTIVAGSAQLPLHQTHLVLLQFQA